MIYYLLVGKCLQELQCTCSLHLKQYPSLFHHFKFSPANSIKRQKLLMPKLQLYIILFSTLWYSDGGRHQCKYICLLNWMLKRTRTATQSDCLVVLGQHLAVSAKLFNAPDGHTLWMTISMVMFGCFLAFMISVSEFLLLSHTSSLTLSISGIFKVSSNSHDHILTRQCLCMCYAPSLERLLAVWTPICHTSFTFHSELCLISIFQASGTWKGRDCTCWSI